MYIVAKDGSGQFTSIQTAIDAAEGGAEEEAVILLRAGEYHERVIVHRDHVRVVGESRGRAAIVWSACAKDKDALGREKGTFLSATVLVTGRDVTLENLTIRNDAGDGAAAGQAVALYAAGDRGAYRRCDLIAHQDTLFCGPMMPKVEKAIAPYVSTAECVPSVGDCPPTRSRLYFEDCFIQGDIDFIFGPYRCWFERCTLYMNPRGGWYTAANTPREQPHGLVFHRCRLTGACGPGEGFLGRPWRPYARTVFLQCEMDEHVSSQGFADWDELKPVTERYGEWGTKGERADQSARHPWQKRLTAQEAREITPEAVLGGQDGWRPQAMGSLPKEEMRMKDQALAGRVRRFVSRLQREDVNMHGFLLSVRGEEKAKAYYAPFREGQPHRMYSVSKTMTGIAIGMLMDEGKLRLDDRIADFFQDWLPPEPSPFLTRLTIRDMLRMATCYHRTAYREGIDENWARSFFTGTPDHEPGAVFYYDTGCSQALAALVRRLSGREVIDFLNDRLFEPLGCRDERYWLRDPSGCCQGGTGLCMSLRDLHRVAQCLMDGGRGVVPAWYAAEMGEKHIETLLQTPREERHGYGWQCWRTRAGWAMYGLGGQLSVICPKKQAILSTIADTRLDPVGVQRIYDAFFEEIYPYIGEEDMSPVQLSLAVHPLADSAGISLPDTPVYTFPEGNPLGIKRMQIQAEGLRYENARGAVSLPFVRGEVKQIAFPGWPRVPALVSAGMAAPGLLRVRCHAVGDAPCGFDMLLSIQENRLTVQCRRSGDPVTEGYEGVASGEYGL